MTIDEIKSEVKAMKASQPDLKLSQCYEVVSHKYGFKDWNTFSAYLKRKS